MHVTKRQLGEGYIAGTSAVFICLLLGMLLSAGRGFSLWPVTLLVPAITLGALVVWFRQLDLQSSQVWNVAMHAALGLGVVTVLLVGSHLAVQTLTVSPVLTVGLTLLVATGTVGGVLVGISTELYSRTRRLTLRNAVLYRLLRHNLRNDMTVVLAQLEDLKSSVNETERRKVEQAERKIHALVELTDKVRQLNLMLEDGEHSSTLIDLVPMVERRVETLHQTYPAVEISTDLAETAPVYVDEQFGIVLDNIVESAVRSDGAPVELTVTCTVEDRAVRLQVEDHSRALPDADLSVIASGTVEQLDHGDNMELWLVYWLVEHNDGALSIETNGETRLITITLGHTAGTKSRLRAFLRQ